MNVSHWVPFLCIFWDSCTMFEMKCFRNCGPGHSHHCSEPLNWMAIIFLNRMTKNFKSLFMFLQLRLAESGTPDRKQKKKGKSDCSGTLLLSVHICSVTLTFSKFSLGFISQICSIRLRSRLCKIGQDGCKLQSYLHFNLIFPVSFMKIHTFGNPKTQKNKLESRKSFISCFSQRFGLLCLLFIFFITLGNLLCLFLSHCLCPVS